MSAGAALRRKGPAGRATYRDVLDAPPHMVAEIVDGALHLQPRPAIRHAVASSFLGGELFGPFQRGRGEPGGWWILDEPELHSGKDVLVPDLAGWRRERLPEPPDEAFFTLAPDWVCEVLSPSARKLDLEKNARSMRGRGSGISGWSILPPGRWRRSPCRGAHGIRRVRRATTSRFPSRPSRPSPFPSMPSGPEPAAS